jgi:DNA-binding transcriptional ArsR family regulator
VSAEAVGWALKQDAGDALAKLVLVALADEAIRSGLVVNYSQREIARVCLTTPQSVGRKTKALMEAGLIEQRWASDNNAGNLYRLKLDDRSFDRLILDLQEDDRSLWKVVQELYAGAVSRAQRGVGPTESGSKEVLTLGFDLEEGEPSKAKRTRARDLAFEALCEVTKFNPVSSRTVLNRCLREIREMYAAEVERAWCEMPNNDGVPMPEVDDRDVADEIRRRGVALQESWSRGVVTPTALAIHWQRGGELAADLSDVLEAMGS